MQLKDLIEIGTRRPLGREGKPDRPPIMVGGDGKFFFVNPNDPFSPPPAFPIRTSRLYVPDAEDIDADDWIVLSTASGDDADRMADLGYYAFGAWSAVESAVFNGTARRYTLPTEFAIALQADILNRCHGGMDVIREPEGDGKETLVINWFGPRSTKHRPPLAAVISNRESSTKREERPPCQSGASNAQQDGGASPPAAAGGGDTRSQIADRGYSGKCCVCEEYARVGEKFMVRAGTVRIVCEACCTMIREG